MIKNLEYHTPVAVARTLMPLLWPQKNPYSPRNEELGAIFIHVPKTGGSSITSALFGQNPRNIPASRYAAYDGERFDALVKFAFVRNPWDRLLSSYSYLRNSIGKNRSPSVLWAAANLSHYTSFEQFVLSLRDLAFRRRILAQKIFFPQRMWVCLPLEPRHRMDFLGRFETLEQDYAVLASRFGLPPDLQKIRKSDHAPYTSVYTAEMQEVVAGVYRRDIELFGYTFGGLATERLPARPM
jgi:chondroitin 4-sulfotransferase 11